MRVEGNNSAYKTAYRYADKLKKTDGSTSFADSLKAQTDEFVRTEKSQPISGRDMTMAEYQKYIFDKISEIHMHPTQKKGHTSVIISDEAFEAMKNDPEYEKWVLDDLKAGWAKSNPWAAFCKETYSVVYYGASKEECHAEMWSEGYDNGRGSERYEKKSKKSFWELRRKRQKKLDEIYEEKLLKHQAYEKDVMKQKIAKEQLFSGKGVLFLYSAAADIFSHMSMFF